MGEMVLVKEMTSFDDSITEMPLESGVGYECFPSPLASHEDVVNNPGVFKNTLNCFHSALGTRINIPVIGGKELDLHILYVEVTTRGGFQKVVEEKKWREISTVFRFGPTTTSASYVLRKHYMSNLLHYEQVYFLKQKIPFITHTSPVALPAKNPSCRPAIAVLGESVSDTIHNAQIQNGGSKCSTVVGKISGKFEHGYFVTVNIGSEMLHGVLYHPAAFETSSPVPSNNSAIVPYNSAPPSNRRKRKRRKLWDPAHPKPNRSAYNYFFSDKHTELKSLYPNREREFTKMIGEAWNNLTEAKKQVYQEIGIRDKERYRKELSDYKERNELPKA